MSDQMDQSTSPVPNTGTDLPASWRSPRNGAHSTFLTREEVFTLWHNVDIQSNDYYDYPAFIDIEEPVTILDPLDATDEHLLLAEGYEKISRPWPKAPSTAGHHDRKLCRTDTPDANPQDETSSSDTGALAIEHNEPTAQEPYHDVGHLRTTSESNNRPRQLQAVSKNTAVAGSRNSNRRHSE